MKSKEIKQRINKLWKLGKKDLDKIIKDTSRLVKKGEDRIKEASKKVEKNLEAMVFSLQREKLYHELGKSLSNIAKDKWTNSKKIKNLLIRLKDINRNIRKTNKK